MSALKHRPPVVVVLGHVDHGKTSLLDYIRKTNLTSKEAGSITQSIGGYEAEVPVEGYDTNKITFIDTPGHEAFSQLRMRGAKVADVAILIVDATASVMPQTIESISHIQQAEIPYIVAVNKVDLPNANIEKVKRDLGQYNVFTEGLGGTIPVVPISAKNGTGVQDLLEAVLFVASESNLTFDPDGALEAYVIEVNQEKAGPAASCIIKNGTLRVTDTVYAIDEEAKVRSLITDRGLSVREVVPSMPFVLFGFKNLPQVGVSLSREKIEGKITAKVSPNNFQQSTASAQDYADFFTNETEKKLKIILKLDSQGALEALLPALAKNPHIEIILASIGGIAKSDIFLAKVSEAIVIGFNVNPDKLTEKLAVEEKVVIKTYSIIYNLLDELNEVSTLLQEKESKARSLKGEAKVQAVFNIDGSKIAGVKITKGKIDVKDRIELFRNDLLKFESQVVSIKQRAKSVKVATKNDEAGLLLDPELDIMAGDVVKSYSI